MKVPKRCTSVLCFLLLSSVVSHTVLAQQTPAPVTLSQVLTMATSALGTASLPADITTQATMQITAGGSSETATLTAAARGTAESYEVISGPFTNSKFVFAQGEASLNGTETSLELACTAQSAMHPAELLAAIAADPDTYGQVVGLESVRGVQLLHFTTWKKFPMFKDGDSLTSFTQRDWWIEPNSGVLRRLLFQRRAAGGATAGVSYDYQYLAFQNASGVLIPSAVSLAVNGVSYASINTSSVQVNTGLTDQDFLVQ
jgi:hypothetical protein